jgi:hypothetical protein
MEAAFDDSDDSDDEGNPESRPLNPIPTSPSTTDEAPAHMHIPGTYDFESADYDFPPPGSPPRPSAIALPNDHGNSNGLIPSFNFDSSAPVPKRGWLKRTAAAVLPSYYVRHFGLGPRPAGAIGGGTHNDGVFANVTAKPTRTRQIQDGETAIIIYVKLL